MDQENPVTEDQADAPDTQELSESEPEPEGDEQESICFRCKNEIDIFDIFCGNCARPIFKGFKYIFIFQIILFFGTAIALGYHQSPWIPAIYLIQLVFFYFLWFIKKQPRFWATTLLFGSYIVLSLLNLEPKIVFLMVLPFYMTLGFIILASKESADSDRFMKVNLYWLVIAMSYWTYSYYVKGIPQDHRYYKAFASNDFAMVTGIVKDYAVWVALGGYLLTLALDAAALVVKAGVSAPKEYIKARIENVTSIDTVGKPFVVIPFIVIQGTIKKTTITFYNTLIIIANAIIRVFVFMYKLTIKYFTIVSTECWRSIVAAFNYIVKCFRFGIIPAVVAILAAQTSVKIVESVTQYIYEPLWGVGMVMLWNLLMLVLLCFVLCIIFVSYDFVKITTIVFRDLAVIIAYVLMLFPFISLTLWVTAIAMQKVYPQKVLPYGLGKFTFTGILLMSVTFVAIFYWQSKKKLQEAQRGITE